MEFLLLHHHNLQNIAVCWEYYCLKLITICTRQGDITERFFLPKRWTEHLVSKPGFLEFLEIWLVLSWLAENWNWNEFRVINKFDYFFTPVSCGNLSRSIFSHYSETPALHCWDFINVCLSSCPTWQKLLQPDLGILIFFVSLTKSIQTFDEENT